MEKKKLNRLTSGRQTEMSYVALLIGWRMSWRYWEKKACAFSGHRITYVRSLLNGDFPNRHQVWSIFNSYLYNLYTSLHRILNPVPRKNFGYYMHNWISNVSTCNLNFHQLISCKLQVIIGEYKSLDNNDKVKIMEFLESAEIKLQIKVAVHFGIPVSST